jgi:hypothetical protein
VNFDKIHHAAARQQLKLLGGGAAIVTKGSVVIDPALVLIERDVQVQADSGLSIETRNIASLLKAEVGTVNRGDQISQSGETFSVQSIMSDDGFVVMAFVRG